MPEQPLTLRFVLHAISRHRLLLFSVLMIGALAGIAYGIERPPLPSASALVLLPPNSLNNASSSSGTPTNDVNTQVIIATSTPVLSAAGLAVSPPVAAQTLKRDVTVTAVSQDVLRVVVHYPQRRDVVRLTNAVASSYVYFVTKAPTPSVENELAGLQQQADLLTKQVQSLQSQVNVISTRLNSESPSSTQGRQDTALIQSLRNEENQYSLELDNVANQIATAQLSTGPSAIGTAILQKAVSVAPISKLYLAIDGIIGAAAGLILGIILVVVRSHRDRRLRLRDEIAATTGTPVLGSLQAQACKTSAAWRKVLDHHAPSAIEMWTVRRVLNAISIGRSGGLDVQVVAFADDGPALTAGAYLALSAAQVATPTALVPSDHRVLAPLRAASRLNGGSPEHLILTTQVTESTTSHLIVSLVPVERDHPEIPPSEGTSLIVVSSGAATAEDLARLALAAAEARDGIAGVVVVNPEPRDPTTGSVPESTTLRRPQGRGRAPAMERSHLTDRTPTVRNLQ